MSETSGTVPEAAVIADAVENALHPASALTMAQKEARARAVYLAWRNSNLGGLEAGAFARVEAASPALIAAIADLI